MYRGQHRPNRRILRVVLKILAVLGLIVASFALAMITFVVLLYLALKLIP